MPLRRQPKSLFELTVINVVQFILKACVQIEATYGCYEVAETRAAIAYLQEWLLERIPVILMDNLNDNRIDRLQSMEFPLRDPKILLGVYLHRHLRSLFCHNISLRAINCDQFWMDHLPRLNNLTALDFKLMCTDELLEVVGENCPKLEYINCISKMSTANRATGNLNFNALRVELHVSNVGLRHLRKCKLLKKICMNRKINSHCAGRKPTIGGIQGLVRSLPRLQCLTFEDLGSVISAGMESCGPLSLQQVSDTHPTSQHMCEIARLCPLLKDLFLVKPINPCVVVPGSADEYVIETLSQTDIKLRQLGLEYFEFDASVIHLLSVKGDTLTGLQFLTRYDQITSQELLIIGESCPNLSTLNINGLTCERHFRYKFPKKSLKMFQNLTCLYLGGNRWDPCVILPLCVTHAQRIGRLMLLNEGNEIMLDNIFANLIPIHKFLYLKVLHLFEGCSISFDTLRTLVYHCPNLVFVKIKAKDFTRGDIDVLIKELQTSNYDTYIDVLSVPYRNP